MRVAALIIGCALGTAAFARDGGKVPLGDVAESAVQQSKLTLPGSKPFHLKAEIVETTNPISDYQAKIEEYWVSPEKWRRSIESPGFSQTLIVNEGEVSEKDTGDYFPWWLNNLVTAMTDPLPMAEQLKQIHSQIAKPRGSENSNTCADVRTKIDRWIFCFEGSHGLLTSVSVRGYSAEFKDFKGFGDKRVARLIVIDPEPGTTIQTRITELTEFRPLDEVLFAVLNQTPLQERINTVTVDETTVRGLALNATDILWPPVGGGPTTGRCAVYVSADRAGRIREVWPQGCDNPGLQDPLREIVRRWQLKPATKNGAAVQIQALVTFTFDAKLVKADPIPGQGAESEPAPTAKQDVPKRVRVSEGVMRSLLVKKVQPNYPEEARKKNIQGSVVMKAIISRDGAVQDLTAVSGDPLLVPAALEAAQQWKYKPYLLNGQPVEIETQIMMIFGH
jgi:TonB family protein